MPLQHFMEFRLTDQQQLHDLVVVGVDVRQQPQLLERFAVQILGFVDDQYGLFAVRIFPAQ